MPDQPHVETSTPTPNVDPKSIVASPPGSTPGATSHFISEQPAWEWLVRVFLGAYVQDTSGERVGDVNDLLFDAGGRITAVVLGVGGILGLGERNVAVPFGDLAFSVDKDGARIISVAQTKAALQQAPTFKATEKTTMDSVKDKAAELSHMTADKAVGLKDLAAKKIVEMTKSPR